jgi:teichuronic acid biosynthesis glycosyltransferase TuaG
MNLVSIIIPYYKKKNYIEETLNSAINPTYKETEIIIIYDDPDHNDLSFLKEIIKKDIRIKLIINDINLGAGKSRNVGIKKSSGDYIAFLDSDDIWLYNKIETQLKFMKENNAVFSHTSYKVLNKDLRYSIRHARDFNYLPDLLKSCDIGLSTVMLKKNLLNYNCEFPSMVSKEDFVLWLKILKNGISLKGIDNVLTIWRETENSLSSSIYQKMKDGFNVYYKHMNFNFLKSFIYLMYLSINYIKKSK